MGHTGLKLGVGTLVGAAGLAAGLIGWGCGDPPAKSASEPSINYEVVEQWTIPNGGFGRVVVVDPAQRTEEGLVALAGQLRRDTKADRNAFVYIYDDRRAASLRRVALADNLNKVDMKLHDDHMIGSYFRNINTGFHAVTIALEGATGKMKEISIK